jgi:hypothetical protein
MIILASLLRPSDFFIAPLCFVVLLMCMSVIVRKYKDDHQKKLFLKAFYFKMLFTLIYTLLMSYYYRGGDTEMYYDCTLSLHKAVMDDNGNFTKIFMTKVINVKTPLMNYFLYTDSQYPVFEAMHSPSNFFVPKLALPFSLLFGKSYICMAMFFAFFALGGAIRLYKFFTHFFPQYYREIALATLFLPSATFWSSGVLKDPVCFGAVGYLLYAMFSIFIRKKKYFWSLVWIGVSVILLFYIKVYILLALAPAIVLWLFGEFNKLVENRTLRRIMALLTFSAGVGTAFLLINYVTSDESIQSFRLDTIVETSKYNRELYEGFSATSEGAYFSIQTTNPVLLVLNGIIATLFRPFMWEISSPIVLLSALEALFFTYFTGYIMYKRGIISFFRKAFSNPIFLMCIVFSLIFAAAIGSSATNFGSISRYKIPCLPFYLVMILVMYRQEGFQHPKWLNRLLGYQKKPNRLRRSIV